MFTAKAIIILHENTCGRINVAHTFANKRLLIHKANRSAKCHGQCCKATISVGSLCLKVKGLLTVPLNENDIIQQDFYFCPQKVCLSSMPVCSNVQYLHSVDAEADIAAMDLDIVVI